MLLFYVVGMFVTVVFCAGVYGCVVSDDRSGFEGDLNVNCGRLIFIRPLILLLEKPDCCDVEERKMYHIQVVGGGS